MILYFSGTGNSAYVANTIHKELQDEICNIFDRLVHHDTTAITSTRPWILVVPTYAWRIPRIINDWLQQVELVGSTQLYVVMTCGGSIGNAQAYLRSLCKKKSLEFMGVTPIVMPDNYTAMYPSVDKETAHSMIQAAIPDIMHCIDDIRLHKKFPSQHCGVKGYIQSGIVNTLFYPLLVRTDKFYVHEDACISCGICENGCPLNTIQLKNGLPVWGKECTHCMSCINRCPKQAIEYGEKTKNKERYIFPSDI